MTLISLSPDTGLRLPSAVSPDLRALAFGTNVSDVLQCPATPHLDTLSKITIIVLARTRVVTTNRRLIEKAINLGGGFHLGLTTTNAIQLRWWKSTTNVTYSYNNVVALNTWQWFIAVGDANAGAGLKWRLFTSPLDRLAREATRTGTAEGSGTLGSTAGTPMTIGNATTSAGLLAYQGDLALVALFGDQLSVRAIHDFQADPHPGVHAGTPCLGFWRPGHRGQADVLDETRLSGAAAITGAGAVSGGTRFWDIPVLLGKPSGAHNLAASGTGVATGTASLQVTEALAASGTGTASGSASLTITGGANNCQASGTGAATGSAVLNVARNLLASGTGAATGSATLNVTEGLQASGTGVATGTATLTATSAHNLRATGSGSASGSALLNVTRALAASASGSASATASLNVTKRLTASGTGAATGSAVLRAERRLQAIGGATAGGSAVLTRIIALSASGTAGAVGVAGLYIERRLQATGNGAAFGTARLYSDTPISAQTSRYELQRTLSLGALTALRSGFERERNLALESIKRG